MIPGVVAASTAWQSYQPVRPVFAASGGGAGALSASHILSLPIGWAAGQLAIIVTFSSVANTNSVAASVMTGWARLLRQTSASPSGSLEVWYRELQSGDTAPTLVSSASCYRSWRCFSIQAGTFNPEAPIFVANTATNSTGTSATVPAGSTSFSDSPRLLLMCLGYRIASGLPSVSAYPLPNNQGDVLAGVSANHAGTAICLNSFDAGTTPSGAFTVSLATSNATVSIVIQGA